MNCYVNKKELPASVYHLNLELKNDKILNQLTNTQKKHLNEVFVNLINFSNIIENQVFQYGLSSRLELKKQPSGLVRMFDPDRENLDINCVVEMCIGLLNNPFGGYLIHLENDFSQFELVRKEIMSVEYQNLMQKIYRATG